ncbi:protein LURP-one-related 5-like [Cornus florida]|uniref:protein LURP-one-related 5-like n=1 Tax=Cornus florida TaxID=4283 RepID=UPI0028981995|nr:protein LURP-one-related 5-like [Cornus florida]
MSRIHPAENTQQDYLSIENGDHINRPSPSVLTVWKRSSMTFQGTDGFTVFDSHGTLAFRVDNYTRKSPCSTGGLVLMDGTGKALLSLKPQILSMQLQWNAYRGGEDECGKSSRLFAMRRPISLINNSSKYEAEIFIGGPTKGSQPTPDFRIEGSFARRNCKIIKTSTSSPSGQVLVAKISRKKVNKTVMLNDDVFSLQVQPGFDLQLIMAFVVVLDRICRKPFAPVLCS